MGSFFSQLWNLLQSFFLGSNPSCQLADSGCYTTKSLDAYAKLHGVNRYESVQATRLTECLKRYSTDDIDFLSSSDNSWAGFAALGIVGADGWGEDSAAWIEFNPTPLPSIDASIQGEIIVAEPCNAVSNFAFYRASVELCEQKGFTFAPSLPEETIRAFVWTFANLGFGSTFFHSATTGAGFQADNRPIDIIALLIHQHAVSSLPYDPVLFDLSDTPRSLTAIESAEELTRVFGQGDPEKWETDLQLIDVPFYELAFTATVGTALFLLFDDDTADSIGMALADALLMDSSLGFVRERILPAVRVALSGINVPLLQRVDLLLKFLGTGLKLVSSDTLPEPFVPLIFFEKATCFCLAGTSALW